MKIKVLIILKININDKSHKDLKIQFKWKEFLNIKIRLNFHSKNLKIT